MMKRRGFLGIMAGAPIGAKAAAQDIATSLSDLEIGYDDSANGVFHKLSDRNEYVARQISQFLSVSEASLKRARMLQTASRIEPEVAALRSMSLVNKARKSRDIQFERGRHRHLDFLKGLLSE